jgi:hypothetical protein
MIAGTATDVEPGLFARRVDGAGTDLDPPDVVLPASITASGDQLAVTGARGQARRLAHQS